MTEKKTNNDVIKNDNKLLEDHYFEYGGFKGKLNMLNLDDAERYNNAMESFQQDLEKLQNEAVPKGAGKAYIAWMKKYAKRTLRIFDDVFGKDTANQMFGDQINDLRVIIDAMGQLKAFTVGQHDSLEYDFKSQYLPKQNVTNIGDHKKKTGKNKNQGNRKK